MFGRFRFGGRRAVGEGAFGRTRQARGEHQVFAAGAEITEQGHRVGADADRVGVDAHGARTEAQQCRHLGPAAIDLLQDAGGGDVETVHVTRHHVAGVEIPGRERQPEDIVDDIDPAALVDIDPPRRVQVARHLVLDQPHTPGLENAVEIRRARRAEATAAHALGLGVGVDEHQRPAAAEDELVDGVQGLLGQALGMDKHQDVHAVGDGLDVAG